MIKIAFIEISEKINRNWCPNLVYALVKSDLRREKYDCDILRLDKNELFGDSAIQKIFCDLLTKEQYSLIGIQSSVSVYVVEIIRKVLPRAKIVIGGSNSISYLDKESYDFLIHGPARESILKLVYFMNNKTSLNQIPNLFYKKDNLIFHSGLVKEFDIKSELKDFSPDFTRINFGLMKSLKITTANVVSSLGCPYNSSICRNPIYKNIIINANNLKNLDNSAKKIVSTYYNKIGKGCSFCNICADRNFNSLPNYELIPFIVEQIKYLTLRYPNLERIQINDENSFRFIDLLMQELLFSKIKPLELLLAGRADYFLINYNKIGKALEYIKGTKFIINIACIGFENFSQKELNIYNKGISVNQNISALKQLSALEENYPSNFSYKKDRDHGFIFINPWTTLDDLRINLSYIEKYNLVQLMNPNYPILYQLAIYPYTPIYYLAKHEGLLLDIIKLSYSQYGWIIKDKSLKKSICNFYKYFNFYKIKFNNDSLDMQKLILSKLI
ncbi:MAG: hypothetical protein V1859_03955 [archaeon]